jgi:hypothetical protein
MCPLLHALTGNVGNFVDVLVLIPLTFFHLETEAHIAARKSLWV